jgi:hypothetical protein
MGADSSSMACFSRDDKQPEKKQDALSPMKEVTKPPVIKVIEKHGEKPVMRYQISTNGKKSERGNSLMLPVISSKEQENKLNGEEPKDIKAKQPIIIKRLEDLRKSPHDAELHLRMSVVEIQLCLKEITMHQQERITSLILFFALLEPNNLSIFEECFVKLPHLTTIGVNVLNCSEKEDVFLTEISKHLNKVTSVTKLELAFYHCSALTNDSVLVFSENLKNLTKLTELSIVFAQDSFCDTMTDESLIQLAKSISSLPFLTLLKLNVSLCRKVTDETLFALSESMGHLSLINTLDLNLRYWKLTDAGLKSLSNTLALLSNITTLALDFKSSKAGTISETGLSPLLQAMQNLKELSSLSLNFENCKKISSVGIDEASEAILNLEKITALNIKFPNPYSILQGGGYIAGNIYFTKSESGLKLEVIFDPISDEGLETFGATLRKLKKVTSLLVKAPSCSAFSDAGLLTLKENLVPLKQLLHVELKISNCDQISDFAISQFNGSVTKELPLKTSDFQFARKTISPEGSTGAISENSTPKKSKDRYFDDNKKDFIESLLQSSLNVNTNNSKASSGTNTAILSPTHSPGYSNGLQMTPTSPDKKLTNSP